MRVKKLKGVLTPSTNIRIVDFENKNILYNGKVSDIKPHKYNMLIIKELTSKYMYNKPFVIIRTILESKKKDS